jgi:hypothetical protein
MERTQSITASNIKIRLVLEKKTGVRANKCFRYLSSNLTLGRIYRVLGNWYYKTVIATKINGNKDTVVKGTLLYRNIRAIIPFKIQNSKNQSSIW